MKHPNTDIDRAIASAVDDVPAERVRNWCANAQTRQLGVSLLGQQLGLPIGLKEIACAETGGSAQAMTYRAAAETFVSMNCVGCDLRVPVSADNICAAMVEEAQAARERQRIATADQQVAADAACALAVGGIDIDALLRDDPATDAHVRSLIAALADPERRRDAARILLRAAAGWPELFSEQAGRVMCGMIRDPAVGDMVLLAAWHLATTMPLLTSEVVDAAAVIAEGPEHIAQTESAARVVSEAIARGFLTPSASLVGSLVRQLGPLVWPPWLNPGRLGSESRETSTEDAFQAALLHSPDLVWRTTERLLLGADPNDRACAANAAIRMIRGVRRDGSLMRLVDTLLNALGLPDDDEDADPSLMTALAAARNALPEAVTARILKKLRVMAPEAANLAIQSVHIDARGHWTALQMRQLLSSMADASLALALRTKIADVVESIGRDDLNILRESFEPLLAALVLVSEQHAQVLAALPAGDAIVTTQQFNELELQRIEGGALVRRTVRTISRGARQHPDEAIHLIAPMLTRTSSEVAPQLKVALLSTLGEIGKQSPASAASLVPIVYPHLLDTASQSVRGAAARSLADLAEGNRDVLPDDVLLLCAELLNDEYLHPVASSAIRVFGWARVQDVRLGERVMRALSAFYRMYGDDPSQSSLVRRIVDAQLNLARQQEAFVPLAVTSLCAIAQNQNYYTASDVLGDFSYFARRYPATQPQFVDSTLGFYRRFNLEIAVGEQYFGPGQDDRLFEALYDMDATVVRAYADALIALAKDGASHRNPRYVGALLLAFADPHAVEAFELAAGRLPDQRRYRRQREQYSGIATLLRVEAEVATGRTENAILLLDEAVHLFEGSVLSSTNAPPELADAARDPGTLGSWARFRQQWLTLSPAPADLVPQAAESKSLIEALPLATTERDASIRSLALALTDVLDGIGRWHAAIRAADPAASAHLYAAVARLADAIHEAESLGPAGAESSNLAERLTPLVEIARKLDPSASVVALVEALTHIPFPVPLGDLPVPQDWGARGTQTPGGGHSTADTTPWQELRLGVASVKVDGVDVPPLLEVVAGDTYDIEVEMDLDGEPSDATHLDLQHVSRLSAEDYHFPEERFELQRGATSYRLTGTMRFTHPQSPSSQPIEIKLLPSLVADGWSQNIELFGSRSLHVRVRPPGWEPGGSLAVDAEATLQSVAERTPSVEGGALFEHAADFQWIEFDGKTHAVSIHRAMVIARMHEIGGAVHETEILEEFADEIRSQRFADVFKGSPLLGTFVVPLGGGLFKLKYY